MPITTHISSDISINPSHLKIYYMGCILLNLLTEMRFSMQKNDILNDPSQNKNMIELHSNLNKINYNNVLRYIYNIYIYIYIYIYRYIYI